MAATFPTVLAKVSETVYAPGTAKVYFLISIANKAAPTRAEITAGTDITYDCSGWDGWSVTSNLIDLPRLGTTFNAKRPGKTEAEDSSLTFYGDRLGADVRSLLPRGTKGYILILDAGDIPTIASGVMDVYPVMVSANPKQRSMDDEVLKLQVTFGITDAPVENVAIPANT